jgi:hypothetical protein
MAPVAASQGLVLSLLRFRGRKIPGTQYLLRLIMTNPSKRRIDRHATLRVIS